MRIKNTSKKTVPKFNPIITLVLLAIVVIMLCLPYGKYYASDEKLEMNLRASMTSVYEEINLCWDDVYPNQWYLPETSIDKEGVFKPLVDFGIKETTFSTCPQKNQNYYRIKVVDGLSNVIGVSETVSPKFMSLIDKNIDDDCECILEMIYQVDQKNGRIIMTDEPISEDVNENSLPINDNGIIDVCHGLPLFHEPIVKDYRMYISEKDFVNSIPGAHVKYNDCGSTYDQLEIYMPRTIYSYIDEKESVHFYKYVMWKGKSYIHDTYNDVFIDCPSPFIDVDDAGNEHFMIPIRIIAELTGATYIKFLPQYKIVILNYPITNCGCEMDDSNGYKNDDYDWDILIDSVTVGDEPIDKKIFSVDDLDSDTCVSGNNGIIGFDFSIVNNNSFPIRFVVEFSEEGKALFPEDSLTKLINGGPYEVKSNNTFPKTRVEFYPCNRTIDTIATLITIRLVYDKGAFIESDTCKKDVVFKYCDVCNEIAYGVSPHLVKEGEETVVELEITNECSKPVSFLIKPGDSLIEYDFPTEEIQIGTFETETVTVSFITPEKKKVNQ